MAASIVSELFDLLYLDTSVAHWHDGESFVADAFWESERFIVSHLYNSPLPTTLPYVQPEGLSLLACIDYNIV